MTEPRSAMGLPRLSSKLLRSCATGLKITQLDTGATSLWDPNSEQLELMDSVDHFTRRYITKPRRIGASTELDLEDALWTLICDAAGHRVRCGVFLHVEDKAKERIAQIAAFLQQMGAECTPATFSITFPRMQSEIVGVTAGAKAASRSEGYQRARYEEYAFYKPGAMGEISPSVGQGAAETIVTTIDIAGQNGLVAREMWRAQNDFKKMFFPFEQHESYRADEKKISDAEWAHAQSVRRFKRRDAAAYWLTEIVPNKCEGDVTRAMREYPIVEEDMFAASEARWVQKTPAILTPVDLVKVMAHDGDPWSLEIYKRPKETSGDLVIGVDTATGKEQDRSVVAVVDRVGRDMVACFVSDRIHGDDLAKVARAAREHYANEHEGKMRNPTIYIEDNTTGQIVIQPAQRMGIPHETFDTTEDSKYRGLLEAKRAVESGTLRGPKELADECDELHRDDRGRWKGRKDILMAYGFCATRIAANPPRVGPVDRRDDMHESRIQHGKRIIRAIQKQQRGGY